MSVTMKVESMHTLSQEPQSQGACPAEICMHSSKKSYKGWGVAQVVEHLPSMCKALGPIPTMRSAPTRITIKFLIKN
jgi:hypothetical protein